jgi:helicase SWR1
MDDAETRATVTKLHTLLRPYILRRLKADVEKQLPGKFEHIVYCRLAKRQRLLYDEFMSRASTKETLASNNVLSIVACLMQLRKVCNHPDLFESRPIVTSFAMTRSAVAEYEIKELLVRRKLLHSDPLDNIDLDACGLHFILHEGVSSIAARERRFLDASSRFPLITELPNERPPTDTHTMEGYRRHWEYQQQAATVARWRLISVVNRPRCSYLPVYSRGKLTAAQQLYRPLAPLPIVETDRKHHFDQSTIVPTMVSSYAQRAEAIESTISRFAFATPTVVALDLPARAIPEADPVLHSGIQWDTDFDILHKSSIKLQIQFPDAALLQYDCGKLQELARLLQERKAGGHKVLIFTQMTKVLDVLEMFLSFNGFRYLRLDGSTKTEERPRLTERFNVDPRIFAFISSSRAGGIGIK